MILAKSGDRYAYSFRALEREREEEEEKWRTLFFEIRVRRRDGVNVFIVPFFFTPLGIEP